jgi:hypothetical protein
VRKKWQRRQNIALKKQQEQRRKFLNYSQSTIIVSISAPMFAGAIKGAARSFGAGESARRAVNKGGLVPGGHQDHRQVPTGRRQLAEGVP